MTSKNPSTARSIFALGDKVVVLQNPSLEADTATLARAEALCTALYPDHIEAQVA